jgi:small-conductance mechanosensitive channel
MYQFLSRVYLGNSVLAYLTAFGIFVAGVIIVSIFRFVILARLKKIALSTSTRIDDLVIRGIEKAGVPLLYFASLYAGLRTLALSPLFSKSLKVVSIIVLTYFLIRIFIYIIKFALHTYLKTKGEADTRQKQLNGIVTLISFLIWGLGLIFLMDNLGIKVSAVIAGLGIGGIAIALAAQAILGDLFNYFVIFFDKPFEIGDFIVVDDKAGSVEYIGIKTTRLRSISGEQIIFSNTNLTSSRVHNFKRMIRRRVVFNFSIEYSTPNEKIRTIPTAVKDIISSYKETTFDRSHFLSYGESGLKFENVYYVNTPDYNLYMDIQQEINLKIHKTLEEKGIKFAMPVRNVILNQ